MYFFRSNVTSDVANDDPTTEDIDVPSTSSAKPPDESQDINPTFDIVEGGNEDKMQAKAPPSFVTSNLNTKLSLPPNVELEISSPSGSDLSPENIQPDNPDPLPGVHDVEDPASFANIKLSAEEINLGLRLENQDLSSMSFPSTGGRKFNPAWKISTLPDGTRSKRNWLVYSPMKDAVFCLHCTLFALPGERTVWGTTGCRGWTEHRGERYIEQHEQSKQHLSSQVARIQWISQKRIDSSLAEESDQLVHHNREVLSVIIDCCRYLGEEMLAFRKKDVSEGKLVKLFSLIAKYNPDARVYLEKIEKIRNQKGKLGSNFLSYRNVFDLINVMSNIVVSKIVNNINLSNTYSVILDSIQDISKKECTAVLLRYVEHLDEQGAPNNPVKPEERLIKVFTSGDTTGENLAYELMNTLKSIGINPNGMVGQSMDGAGNMRGRYNGLKSVVLRESPRAFYVWCCSHRFALVVEKSIDVCPQMRNMFSLLQEMYVFMSGHRRHHMFIDNLKKGLAQNKMKSVKRVQTTRWSSKSDALKTVLTCYKTIKETLKEICLDKKSDNDTKASAKGLINSMSDYENICAMHIASTIFKVLSPITICLQAKSVDYGMIPAVISETRAKLKTLRSEKEWDKLTSSITQFSDQHNVSQVRTQRNRKRKRLMDELSIDEKIDDPVKKMKVEVYFLVLDSLLSQLNDRFPDSSLAMVKQMSYFSHGGIMKIAHELETGKDFNPDKIKELCEYYNLDNDLIASELETFCNVYKVTHADIDISDMLHSPEAERMEITEDEVRIPAGAEDPDGSENEEVKEGNLQSEKHRMMDQWIMRGFIRPFRCVLNLSALPNLTVMYRILLSLAVTSCSAERTMSRLKIVKNRLRNSMGDSWLSSLLILSCENNVLSQIQNEEIINKFATTSVQRKKLLLYKTFKQGDN